MKKLNIGYIVLGTLLVILATAGLVVLTSLLFGVCFSLRYPDGTYCGTLRSLSVCALLYFVLLEVLFLLIPISRQRRKESAKHSLGSPLSKSTVEAKGNRLPLLLCILCIVGILLTALICTNNYITFSPDGVETVFFATVDSYGWDDVRAYTVECTEENGFDLILTMRDGNEYSFLNTVNSATDDFCSAYGDLYGYAVYVDSNLRARYISRTVRGASLMESYYKESYPDVWEKILTILNAQEADGNG